MSNYWRWLSPSRRFFARRSYWDEGEQVLSWTVEAAARVGQPHTHAVMLNELGNIHRLKSDFGIAADGGRDW